MNKNNQKTNTQSGNGKIYVVATPIGNLEDFTERAQNTLKKVDLIAAEDTRHSKPLLNFFNISTPMISYHEHNESARTEELLKKVKSGLSIAIISDAGTPLISDPGYRLIAAARKENICVEPIPGACAVVTALSAAGLPSDKFFFGGFLAAKSSSRKKQLKDYANLNVTVICYESSHRICAALQDIAEVLPSRELVLARELTKKFETFLQGTAEELLKILNEDSNQQKGEFVLLMAPDEKQETAEQSQIATIEVLKTLMEELPLKKAVSVAAKITGERKNSLYERALEMKNDS